MSFPAYPSYRESGIDMLGDVPAHWDVVQIRHVIARLTSGTSVNAVDEPASLGQIGVLKTSCVYSGVFDAAENKAVVEDDLDRVTCPVRKGTLIVSRMNTPELVGAAGLVMEDSQGLYLPDRLWQIEFSGADSAFMHEWTRSAGYRTQVRLACDGTSSSMQNLSQDKFCSFLVPLPSRTEQSAIAAFLGRETAKIDALVEEQRRLIELLKEKRQAVISHAVTKGLDPAVPMKHSGVEWLGDVPAHWDVRPLKRDLEYLTSGSRGWAEHYSDEGALFIRIGNLTRNSYGLDLSDIQRVAVPEGAEGARTSVRAGDLLFSITAFLGSVAIAPDLGEPAYVSQHVALARLANEHLRAEWVALVTLSSLGKGYFAEQGYGGTKIQLSLGDVGGILLTVPPIHEQDMIIQCVREQLEAFDRLIREADAAILLLRERRAALISAAVTGKIDVRSAAPQQAQAA